MPGADDLGAAIRARLAAEAGGEGVAEKTLPGVKRSAGTKPSSSSKLTEFQKIKLKESEG